jgi:alpha-glucosidase
MVSDFTKMTTLVEKRICKKSNLKQIIIRGGKHNEKLWRENFGNAVRWMF